MIRAIGFIVFALGIIKLVVSERFGLLDVVGPLLLLVGGAFLLRDKEASREPSLQRPKRQRASNVRVSVYSPVAPTAGGVARSGDGAVEPHVYNTDIYCRTTWNTASTRDPDHTSSSCDPSNGSNTAAESSCSSYSND